ncbi:MG2 domain-containing protein [Geminocystis sp. GBBB08]|uniref:alpha-2-macroglobulin family protein n=1 Tax=Geminocystis sp. GBBB08 TaxID=2604140 RepID=UPI0027E2DA7F|nr:MG2 domain-containing protein [Geminocystis sp. GBBB08]
MLAKGKIRKIIKYGKYLILSVIACIFIVGCNLLSIQGEKEPLPSVSSIPLPTLPNWIEQITPINEAKPLSQILIRFKNPLIPLEKLDTPQQENLLTKFEILPPLAGQFRILTPKMVGFQADKALPKATRIKVTLKSGLSDLKNNTLAEDLAWTFTTETIKLTNLPGKTKDSDEQIEPIDIKPILEFTSNVELDLNSLENKISLNSSDNQEKINIKVALKPQDKNTEYSQKSSETFDLYSSQWIYNIKPQKTLNKGTKYQLKFDKGLRPVNGNLISEFPFSSEVFTYAPLAFDKIENYGKPDQYGVYGRFVNGSPQLKFNNGLIASSAIENITINPAPKKDVKLFQAYDEYNYISINPWALEPNTNYTIIIDSKLKDKFNQTLDKPITLKYQTGNIAPDIWAASDLNIFPSETDLQLNISTVNLPNAQYQASYKIIEPEDLVYSESAYPTGQSNDLLPSSKTWPNFTAKGKTNEVYENIIPLKEKLNNPTGMLAYGVKAKTNSYSEKGEIFWREPEFYGLVQLTNLGVFAQWFPDSGLIKVHHLSDGLPVNNATVEIYESKIENKGEKYPTQPCTITTTNKTGTAIIEGENWRNCLSNNEPPKLLVIARENDDWAFARTNEYSGAYEYGINTGWDDKKPISRGIIFSDRQLYQPGEKAYFTGTAYYLKNGILQQDQNISYQITLTNPDGKEIDLGKKTTNKFGTFSLELPLAKNQPLGNYSLVAKTKTGVEIYGDFRVAKFKPPNFKVDLKLDQEFAFVNDKIMVSTNSNYFFGSPVQGGKVNYYITRQKANFTPKNWDKFNFGRQWFFPEESPEVPNEVLQQSEILDTAGNNTQQITVAQDLAYPMTYQVEAQVTDVSNLSVSNSQTFTALPSEKLIGLQSDFVANTGQSFPVKFIVTDVTGKIITEEKVKIALQSMNYSNVTKLEEGSSTSHQQVEYKNVAQQEVTSSSEIQTVSFTPSDSGSYRIQANFVNSKNALSATDLQIWVTGDNPVTWSERYDNNRLIIQLDKQTYQVGETATALIESPYPEAELYFSVIRHNTIYHTTQKVIGGAPKIQFTITPEMLPNAAVEAVLVRQGTLLSQTEPNEVKNLVRIGFTPFNLNLKEQYLEVKVTPQEAIIKPTTEQTIDLELKDYQGNPIEGQITLMAVNEAILQLTGYSPPDLVKIVYADQDISTRLTDNRPQVILKSPASPLQKGWGYGGGESVGIGNTQIRTDFQALAYYNGSILTDDNGKASVNFTLPDDLTTWKIIAVATDGNLHFGNGENSFMTQKPLTTNAILPQFVRLGDEFLGGVSVTNLTDKLGNLTINGNVSNNFKFTKNSQLKTQVESGTKAYHFPLNADKVGEGKITFITDLNNQEKDAFEVPLEVKNLEVSEQVIISGMTENEVKIPINVDNQLISDVEGLEISLASSLIPDINLTAITLFNKE